MKTVDVLFEESGLWIEDVAERSKLAEERVEAIALGRWTPSPDERIRIAQALSVSVDEVSWGHTMDPRNLRYRRFGLKEDF
ncbi:MAG TPA: XRE family transcriptional regulator [Planctomycetes bacterium]|nr:XRE family transcriptional regulator [Fuerstiella sp.]HIK95476.1 XRE family transcriptional regulator [Planctomycetota bacterium]